MKKKYLFVMGSVALIIILVLQYLQRPTTAQLKNNHPPYGGSMIWGTYNPPTIINPILTSHSISSSLMELIFDSLIRVDGHGNIVPGLAQSWEVSEDGLEYLFHLRKGVFFHDGIEFTAESVQFTYEMINDKNNQSHWKKNTELVENWEVIDKYTLKMSLRESFPLILHKLVREIAPKHLLENQDLQSTSFNYHPIGTGPFKFQSWDRDTNEILLEANLDYFEGRPYLDKILVRTYYDNLALWSAFLRGEVDLINFISRQGYQDIKNNTAFKVYQINWRAYYAIAYDLNDPIFSNKEIRKAIAHSIDKARIMQEASYAGVESTGPFHPESPAFNPEVQTLEYDPLKAIQILKEQGWQDPKSDDQSQEYGIRQKDDQQLTLRLLIDQSYEEYQKIAAMIQHDLAQVGIQTIIQLYQDEKELTLEYLEKYQPQAWLRFLSGAKSKEYESARDWYSLSSEFGRLWPYAHKEVDRLFQLARTTQDEDQRLESYRKIHKIIYDDQPAYFLFFPASFHAVSAKFKNTDGLFTQHMPHYIIKDWYMADH